MYGVTIARPIADKDREPLLWAHGVSVHFGPIQALQGVDLAIRRGEVSVEALARRGSTTA
jgi:ABC-type uncharacterized transport system ATPase subunit